MYATFIPYHILTNEYEGIMKEPAANITPGKIYGWKQGQNVKITAELVLVVFNDNFKGAANSA
jgi:hypothetical protein